MRVKNHLDFAKFDYVSDKSNAFQLGDIVFRDGTPDYDEGPEIGVVLQTHNDHEARTDMFGNFSTSEVRYATPAEIAKYRPELMDHLDI